MQHIRRLTEADVPALLPLEESCFHGSWSEKLLLEFVQKAEADHANYVANGSYDAVCNGAFGLFEEEALLGFVFAMMIVGEGEIQKIAIAPDHQGKGYSCRLMDAFFDWLRLQQAEAATLEVRAGNTPAIGLYTKYGFLSEGRRKNYYQNPVEDALILWNRALY